MSVLMSYNSFEKLVTQIRDDKIWNLDLYDQFLGNWRICELVQELKKNKSVKEVSLWYCTLGSSFADVFSDALMVNTGITVLKLKGINLNTECVRAISEALKVNQSVKKLHLVNNNIGSEGARHIAGLLKVNQFVKELHLGKNNLGDEGTRHIAEALKVNQSVQELLLPGEDLGTEGVKAIAEALKVNWSLKVIYFTGNKIGAKGKRALLKAMQVNGSLIDCDLDEVWNEMDALCNRNEIMHERALESVVYLLALRRMRKIVWIPKEMIVMIGQMLWRTKCDVEAWNIQNNDKPK